MSAKTFTTRLVNDGGVEVPFDVEKAFGKKRLPIRVTVNGVTYPSTVAVYGGRYYFPMRREIREKAGVAANGQVTVTITPDTSKRTVKPPADLAKALGRSAKAKQTWKSWSFTHRKELVDWITSARKAETRATRVKKALERLR
jgi:hypothetical protein